MVLHTSPGRVGRVLQDYSLIVFSALACFPQTLRFGTMIYAL